MVLFLLVAMAACGDHSVVASDGFTRTPCRPPAALAAMVNGTPFAPQSMRSALQHAAGPMNDALQQSTDVRALRDAILMVSANIGRADYDRACRFLAIADGLLIGLPASSATMSDRDGIRLVFALTARSLDEVMPK